MKKIKNYITPELAKKKLARYNYWAVKDENGILICSAEDNNPENKSFGEVLDKIIADNVDAEVQIKYGTNEQSARQNPPFFVRINEEIEWIEPEDEQTVSINGVPHKMDKNGNVNINLLSPKEQKAEKAEPVNTWRDELEMQLNGMRKEYELKQEGMKQEMHNKLMEQNIKFKEVLLAEKEAQLSAREQAIMQAEAELEEKRKETREDLKGYIREIPSALGGVVKDWIKESKEKKDKKGLGASDKKEAGPPKKQTKVKFTIKEDKSGEDEGEPTPDPPDDDEFLREAEEEIGRYEQMEQQHETPQPAPGETPPSAWQEEEDRTDTDNEHTEEPLNHQNHE